MKYLNPLKLRTIAATLVAFAFIASAVAPLRAQQPAPGQDKGTSRSKVERKNRAPVSKEVLRVKLPKPVEATLDNGLTVMILEDHRFPVVNMNLQMSGAGPIFDPADKPGLANLTAQMLREGTKTRNSRQIAEEVDKLGATLGANSGFGSTAASISASGLSDNFDQWFGLMADMLMNPSFPADEFGKLKARQKTASDATAHAAWFSFRGTVPARRLRESSRGRLFDDSGGARCADAGDARGVASRTLCSAECDSRHRGRREGFGSYCEAERRRWPAGSARTIKRRCRRMRSL